jgi:hypothetical protein
MQQPISGIHHVTAVAAGNRTICSAHRILAKHTAEHTDYTRFWDKSASRR